MLNSGFDQASGSLGSGGNKKWEEERGNWLIGFGPIFSSRANSFSTLIGVCPQMKKWDLHVYRNLPAWVEMDGKSLPAPPTQKGKEN